MLQHAGKLRARREVVIFRWMGSSTPPRPPVGRHAHARPGGGIGQARIEAHHIPAHPGAHAPGRGYRAHGGAYPPRMTPARPCVSDSVVLAMREESNQDNVSVCVCLYRLVIPGRVSLGLSHRPPKSGSRAGGKGPPVPSGGPSSPLTDSRARGFVLLGGV